jgi:CIC family chloride channel protein
VGPDPLDPVAGGLVVGLILHWFTPDGRVRSVADVIEGAALRRRPGRGRAGLASALASLITLSTGRLLGARGAGGAPGGGDLDLGVGADPKADGVTGRDLLGCAVAAAVSASFNAPIAGALFALEVVLQAFRGPCLRAHRHRLGRGHGHQPAGIRRRDRVHLLEGGMLQFYVELPAFLILGLVSG